jgi:hypothetical protein
VSTSIAIVLIENRIFPINFMASPPGLTRRPDTRQRDNHGRDPPGLRADAPARLPPLAPRFDRRDTRVHPRVIARLNPTRTQRMKARNRFVLPLAFALPLLCLAAGCEAEKKAKPKLQTRETLKKTTQVVLDLKPELEKGGQVTSGKIESTDYLGVQADAYRTSVGNIAKMRVQNDINMYEVTNGEKPKTYEEFMEKIIKKGQADGIQLPMLPYYQEYGYDSDKKELVVIDYPAKKKAFEEQQAKELGYK